MDFDDQGRLIARIDQNGTVNRLRIRRPGSADAWSCQDGSDGAESLRTEYEYDELGNLIVQRDAEGAKPASSTTALGRRTATVLPLGQRSETTYDAVGRVESTTDFNGDTIPFEYDTRDRLTQEGFSSRHRHVVHLHGNGQRETVTDGRGVTTYEYDARDRLLSRTDPDGSADLLHLRRRRQSHVGHTDVIGNPTRTTTYTFDELNRQQTVTDPEGGVTTYFYDAAGRLVRTELPNGTFETREYDALNRLVFLENRAASGVICQLRLRAGRRRQSHCGDRARWPPTSSTTTTSSTA